MVATTETTRQGNPNIIYKLRGTKQESRSEMEEDDGRREEPVL